MALCRILDARTEDPFECLSIRQIVRDEATERVVASIIEDVRTRGDEALLETSRRFDSPHLASILVTDEEMNTSPGGSPARAARMAHSGSGVAKLSRGKSVLCRIANTLAMHSTTPPAAPRLPKWLEAATVGIVWATSPRHSCSASASSRSPATVLAP